MKQTICLFWSITALLLFMQCSNKVSDTTYDNETLGCNCDDKDVLCDPPPDLIILPLTPLSPLPISIPKISGFPQYDDWDTIYLYVEMNCGWDTKRMDTMTITSVKPFVTGNLWGINVDGTSVRKFFSSLDSNCTEFANKICDYLKFAMMKKKYYVIEDDVSMDSSAYFYNFDIYKERGTVPISIELRLIPEK